MTKVNSLRNRHRQNNETEEQNGADIKADEKSDPEFIHRESVLTVLIENSLHIRAIYHIFVVILIMLLLDTMIYDLVERGKINIGLSVIFEGFGGIRRAAVLWLFEFGVALSFYPCLHIYSTCSKMVKKYPDNRYIRQGLTIVGLAGLIFLMGAIIAVPLWSLSKSKLPLGSSIIVTCEMFRFVMKVQAIARACASRCSNNGPPLPTFKHFVYFLFAPTLIYRDQYPRTKKIRWSIVTFHIMEVAAIIFYNSFLWERFILPYWSDYGKEPTVEAGTVVRGMFACVLPGVISFLCCFYCILHAWLNAFAEILRFGDRLFYEDWWTTSRFSRYYRAWNIVVHAWLRNHIYMPLTPYTGRAFATFAVFFVSAIAHEIILASAFGFFYPVLLLQFGVVGLLLLPITTNSGRNFPYALNLIMWLSFFFGNGLLWSLYPMEYFARQNCPPSENDSFFIPKSLSCPKLILKPNWSFQNPLDIIY